MIQNFFQLVFIGIFNLLLTLPTVIHFDIKSISVNSMKLALVLHVSNNFITCQASGTCILRYGKAVRLNKRGKSEMSSISLAKSKTWENIVSLFANIYISLGQHII